MRDLRDLILEKSVEIIAENGIRGLSFREVARRANVSHQAPYHYFKNDSEILSAITKEGFTKLGEAMKEASTKYSDQPIEALNAAGIAYVLFALEYSGHFRVMFQRSLLPKELSISGLIEAQRAHQILKDLVSEIKDLGIAKNLDLDGLTMLCWSTAHGLATLLSEGVGGSYNDKKLKDRVTKQVIAGLGVFLKISKNH